MILWLYIFGNECCCTFINKMLLQLFVQLYISFLVLLCHSLLDTGVILVMFFVLNVTCLVSDRRQLSVSERELKNFFSSLVSYYWCTRKLPQQECFLEFIYNTLKRQPHYQPYKTRGCTCKYRVLYQVTNALNHYLFSLM